MSYKVYTRELASFKSWTTITSMSFMKDFMNLTSLIVHVEGWYLMVYYMFLIFKNLSKCDSLSYFLVAKQCFKLVLKEKKQFSTYQIKKNRLQRAYR